MNDFGEGPQGSGIAPAPAKDYSAGRKLRGLSAEVQDRNKYAGLKRGVPGAPERLTSAQLITIALELGFNHADFGIEDPGDEMQVMPRVATDAEALYLQVPALVPLGFYATFFGATSPALFWSDLGFLIPSKIPAMPLMDAILIWWQMLHLARDPSACQSVLGESASLVLGGYGFDGKDYEISLAPSALGAGFLWAPRGLVTAPKAEYDEQKHHREIVGFGFSQCMYFSRIHLRGSVSASLYGPERISMGKAVNTT